jgi:hypothetical protein
MLADLTLQDLLEPFKGASELIGLDAVGALITEVGGRSIYLPEREFAPDHLIISAIGWEQADRLRLYGLSLCITWLVIPTRLQVENKISRRQRHQQILDLLGHGGLSRQAIASMVGVSAREVRRVEAAQRSSVNLDTRQLSLLEFAS